MVQYRTYTLSDGIRSKQDELEVPKNNWLKQIMEEVSFQGVASQVFKLLRCMIGNELCWKHECSFRKDFNPFWEYYRAQYVAKEEPLHQTEGMLTQRVVHIEFESQIWALFGHFKSVMKKHFRQF